MIPRNIAKTIHRLKSKYPVISITGPRQSGKTTLAQSIFDQHEYLNLENPDSYSLAKKDPKSFLKIGTSTKIIVDEVQKVPELLSYIQTEVDQNKLPAQFVLTGSQHFSLSQHISQSLAGRVANFTLLPLSFTELDQVVNKHNPTDLIIRGFYPAIIDQKISPKDYFRDYVFTYVERDVRQIVNVGDLANFQRMLILLAGRVGQLVNYSSLADDVGVSYKTINSWLSVLEASYLIFKLQPYYENFGKRVIKSPKIYFIDTGLLCYLLSVNSSKELERHYLIGSIFENFIIAEKLKEINNTRAMAKLYFWNDNNRNEVDLIVDQGLNKEIVEIKSSQTFSENFLKGLNHWSDLATKYQLKKLIVYNGSLQQSIRGVKLINWYDYFSKTNL